MGQRQRWSEKMTISVTPEDLEGGMGREGAWNSPISAGSFPKIEKGDIFSSSSGTRWGPSTPIALGLCAGCFSVAHEHP